MTELPIGWEETKIGEIARIETGSTPSKSSAGYYAKEVCFFKPGDLDAGGMVSQSEDMVSKTGAAAGRLLPPHTLLITCIGNLGKSALTASPSICNQQINAVLPTPVAEPQYLYYWSRTIKSWLRDNSSATTVSIINKGRFLEAPIRIAPLPEQRRIVAKIDSLSANSKRARDHLNHILPLVEKYKQAILTVSLSSADGSRITLGELTASDAPIRYGVIQPGEETQSGIPLIRVCDLHDGSITWPDLRRISSKIDRQYANARVRVGDILISVVGTIGRIALVDNPPEPTNIARAIARVRPDQRKVVPEWLAWRLQARDCQDRFHFAAREVARKTLNISLIRDINLVVPPLPQQHLAISIVRGAFAWINRLASETTRARKLIDRLDQAVLAKAFQGELVPQDPSDEPASILLERIRAERATGSGHSGRRGRRRADEVRA
jgi:type I restriction enzyme, S subunit